MTDRIVIQKALAENIKHLKSPGAKQHQAHILCADLIAMLKEGRQA